MTEATTKTPARVGDTVTVLGAISLPDPERGDVATVRQRGHVFVLTDAVYEASKNRYGWSFFDDISTDTQVKAWGTEKLALGDLSETVLWWQEDSSSARLAYDHEMANAALIADHEERAATVTAIRKKFANAGLNPSNQVSRRFPADRDPHATEDAR
ncbi:MULTISPECIES: hypothetical protein [Microbacterium]|uniref:hypothetical protein n=1 Tax=Microbacterium TaxID=33882 RepID=UPI00277E67E8|nr:MULTISPECIES: hypothetical protein [Microbacterium]MDQ1083914.1 hypothetical protein [Microbacterium sp. SORGH_AS_0344]MDQ1170806.1 hypothetical protein [Microbacterium proteolyticum]